MQGKVKLYLVIAVMALPLAVGVTMLVPSRAEAWHCSGLNDLTISDWLNPEIGLNPCLIEDKVFTLLTVTDNLLDSGKLTFDDTMMLNPGFTYTFDSPLTVSAGDTLSLGLLVRAELFDLGVPIHDVSYKIEGTNDGMADLKVSGAIKNLVLPFSDTFACVGSECNAQNEILFSPTNSVDLLALINLKSFTGAQSITAISFHFSEGTDNHTVPEPAPFGLLGSGLIGLVLFRQRLASLRV